MKISELAEQVAVATSTIRYYERIGLLPAAGRTASGYRNYDDGDLARLVFVTHAKRIGLTLEQIRDLLPIWDGVNCSATHEQISKLVEAKIADIAEQMKELQALPTSWRQCGRR